MKLEFKLMLAQLVPCALLPFLPLAAKGIGLTIAGILLEVLAYAMILVFVVYSILCNYKGTLSLGQIAARSVSFLGISVLSAIVSYILLWGCNGLDKNKIFLEFQLIFAVFSGMGLLVGFVLNLVFRNRFAYLREHVENKSLEENEVNAN